MNTEYRNASLAPQRRAELLLQEMTPREKLAQLSAIFSLREAAKRMEDGTMPPEGFGGAYMDGPLCPGEINRIQRFQVEETRLGIPFLLAGEGIHGLMAPGAVVFPQELARAAAFDPALEEAIAAVIGEESRALGVRQIYGPDLDLLRDPRWGRSEETYGEDPYLVSRLGAAYIRGLQLKAVAATAKHFLGHGSPEGGFNCAPAHLGEREVRETMLEPFRAAVEADVAAVMPAYHELDGIPMHASEYWLRTVLRRELGFRGAVISDADGIRLLKEEHHVARTEAEAGELALQAGVDFEIPYPRGYGEVLLKKAEAGQLPLSLLDGAVLSMLTLKFRLGLFEQPYAPEGGKARLRTEKALALAEEAAVRSAVLLKNNGALPLRPGIKKLALVGPGAAEAQLGDYTDRSAGASAISLKQALEEKLGAERLLYAKGCSLAAESREGGYAQAVDAAKQADAVIVALCESSSAWAGRRWGDEEGGNTVTCGENFDSCTAELPEAQKELLRQISRTGKPTVLLLITGRPCAVREEASLADAVIQAFYPGERGGKAMAALLFGEGNFSGKLPATLPRSAGFLPCFYNYKVSARGEYSTPDVPAMGIDRQRQNPAALYPFGFGLSYTEFAYRDLTVQGREVAVTVENTGKYAGTETVLFFIRRSTGPVTPFVKQLFRFEKVFLRPGESARIRAVLGEEDLSFVGKGLTREAGRGTCTVSVGCGKALDGSGAEPLYETVFIG